jgi:phage tail sheath protein FI
MPFQLSPGVAVVEKDFTSIVPAVSSSIGAFAGAFPWGPVMEPTTVGSENELVRRFGKPNDSNFQSFFTAANFLSYTNNLLLVRADAGHLNAVANKSGAITGFSITNAGSGYSSTADAPTVTVSEPDEEGGVQAVLTAVISGGALTAIAITNGGTNYSAGTTVSVTAAAGDTGAGASAIATVTDGVITGFSITGGSGYKAVPTLTLVKPTTVTRSATGTSGETTIVVSPSTGIFIGMDVTGTGIAEGTKVTSVSGTTITLSDANTDTVSNNVTFTDNGADAVLGNATIGGSTITGLTIVTSGTGYTDAPSITIDPPPSGTTATATSTVTTSGVKIINGEAYLANFVNGAGVVGPFAAKYPGSIGNSLKVSMADSATFSTWTYRDEFDAAPATSSYASSVGGSNDELHIIVIDEDGLFTGSQNTILEKFAFVSKASDAKKPDGTNNYYKNVLNARSEYVYWMDHPASAVDWGLDAAGQTYDSLVSAVNESLDGGTDDFAVSDAEKQNAFALFANAEQYDISLVMLGKASATTAQWVINNICETRLDCIALVSPENTSTGEVIIGSTSTQINQITAYRDLLSSTSYAVMDSGYKYQYDRYNDQYRYVPLNGDVAGLCARTDFTNDPWFSPGGLNRGQIKNVVRLAVSPTKTQRDTLYKKGVNPVVTFPGEGTVLFGDKTLLAKPSAFDRINVRRLFIVMEKAIATAAKFQLFEFNDGFTRAQFKNLVEPFLRDVQGRRGITDFVVKCDESNNTGEVIDRNEFVADIFVKPNRSINFITLNFVAARSAINFSEIGA